MAMVKLLNGRIMYAEPSTACDHVVAQLKAAIDGVAFDEEAWLRKVGGESGDLDRLQEKLIRRFMPPMEG